MINVIIKRHRGSYQSFICTGHAEYAADDTADIVCAGVSAVVINTINCLKDLLEEEVGIDYDQEEGGLITCVFTQPPSDKASFLIDCMIHGLKWIQAQYGEQYLTFEIEEVRSC